MKNSILLVDDEPQVLKALQRLLIDEDYDIVTAGGGAEALQILEAQPFKVVLSDERMPRMSGSELLAKVSLRYPQTVRIMLTGYASLEAAMAAVNQGEIYRFLLKPWNDAEMKMAIRSAIDRYDLEMRNRKLLAMIRTQAFELSALKEPKASASPPARSNQGRYALTELSESDIAEILRECGFSDN